MEAPPPPPTYYSTPPAPKKNTGCIIAAIIVGLFGLCCVGVIGLGGFFGKDLLKGSFGIIGCSIAVSSERDAILAYAKDHDGRLPKAATWQDDVAPYYHVNLSKKKDKAPFDIPEAKSDHCDMGAGTSVYFNSSLSGKKLSEIKNPEEAILFVESPGTGRNQNKPFSEPPFTGSPKLFAGVHRGWLHQPLYGDAYLLNENGMHQPIQSVANKQGVTINSN